MAPGRTSRKGLERGPGDWTAVGVKGRRTGAELKDTGARDENGLEPIPSFSSPANPALQPNGITLDATYSADDSMDIDQSTIPEPTDVVRSVRNGRISLPPRATSPIKTHLNSSPRRRSVARSVGPMSSPSRNLNNGTPTRATSHPPNNKPVNRQLDFSMEKPHKSIEYSPQKATSTMKPPKPATTAGKGRNKRAFDLSIGADDPEGFESDALNGETTTNGICYDNDADMLPNGDDQLMFDQSLDQAALEDDHVEQQDLGAAEEDTEMVEPLAPAGPKDGRRKPGRRASTVKVISDESQADTPRRGRPGRPSKKDKPPVYQDPTSGPMAAPPKSTGNRKPPPKLRDPNAKIVKRNTSKQPSIRSASLGPRSRFLQRSETPANDDGALLTRSGRHSFKPLKSWLGEKVVMGDRFVDALPGIIEVVRVDEIDEGPRPRRSAYRKPKRRVRSQLDEVEEEEDDADEKADWEVNDGIKVAQVLDWDPETNKYDEENTREEDVAYSFDAIEMRDIANAEFKFAKTLTLDFFGAGMVEVPPGGAKRIKNSRKMQMVFFVFYGRVMVNIGTPPTRFSIGKGGQWQVPRGNFYSITNESETKSARIFFAQGCEVQAGFVDESTMAYS